MAVIGKSKPKRQVRPPTPAKILERAKAVRLFIRFHPWDDETRERRWSLSTLYLTQEWPYDARVETFLKAIHIDDEAVIDISDDEMRTRFKNRFDEYGTTGGIT